MKKSVTRETYICDECGKDAGYRTYCVSCEREYCYECSKEKTIEYAHSVHFAGSGDIHVCHTCNLEPKQYSKLIDAYKKIQALSREEKDFYEGFKARCELVEKEAEKYAKSYGIR